VDLLTRDALGPNDPRRLGRRRSGGKINKLARVSDRLRDGLGHMPTDEEIALDMGLDASTVAELRQVSREVVWLGLQTA
jgi:DNA-directed RNA polymerase sigma subunit (sigma70/sigma32)